MLQVGLTYIIGINIMTVLIPIITLPHAQGLELPQYATPHAAGMDLVAAINAEIHISPHSRKLIPTGLIIALPNGYEAQVRPRSGLALKHGITVLNSPGTIDADYRGELQVILINLGEETFTVTRGMRIAQMIIAQHATVQWDNNVSELDGTARGAGGFGSTGVR